MLIVEFLAIAVALATVWYAGRMYRFPPAGAIFIFGFCFYVYVGALFAGTDLIAADMAPEPYFRMLTLVRVSFWIAVVTFIVTLIAMPQAKVENLGSTQSLDKYQVGALHAIAVLCALANIIFVAVLPVNPWTAMFGDQVQVAYLREQATTAFRWFPLFSVWLSFITPFVYLVYWFANYTRLAIGLLVLNTLVLLLTGQKAPLVYSLLAISLAAGLRYRQFPYLKASVAGVLAVIVLIAIVVLQNFNVARLGVEWSFLVNAWDAIVTRVIAVGSHVVYGYVDYFPLRMDFYYLHPPEIPPDQLVFKHLNPNTDIIGTANAAFVASVYAAFGGVPQLLFSAIAIFLSLLFLGERLCLRQQPSPFSLALYVVICLGALKMCITDLSTVWLPILFFVATARGLMMLMESGLRWLDTGVLGVRGNLAVIIPTLLISAYVVQGLLRKIL